MFVGLFQRCEYRLLNILTDTNRYYPICDDNKYMSYEKNLSNILSRFQTDEFPRLCNVAGNPYGCSYSIVGKALIASTIIAACMLTFSLLLIYSHLLINQFKYKTHLFIAIATIVLLLLAFIFILITLILLGSTMAFDLFEYRYNLQYGLIERRKYHFQSQRTSEPSTMILSFSRTFKSN